MSPPNTITLDSPSESRTVAIGRRLATVLQPGDFVAIRGELGAGKTRLVRGIIEGLGHAPGAVSSPTFVVMNQYDDPHARLPVAHIDAYRLAGEEELANAGFDTARDGVHVVLVEWPERIAQAVPNEHVDVLIEHLSDTERRIRIAASWGRDLSAVAAIARRPECRICGATVEPDSPAFPFCSSRCRTIDLGKWITGDYKITREVKDEDLETTD